MNPPVFRLLGAALLIAGCLHAAAPELDHLFPAAVQQGVTNAIALVGTLDPWPPSLWADDPGIRFLPATNAPSLSVIVDATVPAGPHWIRAHSPQGASSPRLLIVTPHPLVLEHEPNDDFRKAQPLDSLPTVVEGRLEKSGDVDSFSMEVRSGQTLVAWVDAYTLMTPLDMAMRVLDERGNQVAWNHDSVRSFDPALSWTAPVSGKVIVQVFGFSYPADSDVRFAGSARGIYRLHLSTGPVLQHTLPLGAQRGTNTSLTLHGWNLESAPAPVAFRPVERDSGRPGFAEFQPTGFRDAIELPVGDGPERVESEPNDTREQAGAVEIPGAVSGDLNHAEDVDRFRFVAKKGEAITLEVQATRLGFPLDSWLAVEDASGKELVRNDDATGADPRIEWTPTQDGIHYAVVGNLVHTGGTDLRYRLQLRHPSPELQSTVADHAFSVEAGKTTEIKVTLTRIQGFNAPLRLRATGLPTDVEALPVEVAATAADAVLKLVAKTNAAPFSGPIRILATETGSGREHQVVHSLAATGENNGVPQGFSRLLRERIADLWLTVPPPAPAKPAAK